MSSNFIVLWFTRFFFFLLWRRRYVWNKKFSCGLNKRMYNVLFLFECRILISSPFFFSTHGITFFFMFFHRIKWMCWLCIIMKLYDPRSESVYHYEFTPHRDRGKPKCIEGRGAREGAREWILCGLTEDSSYSYLRQRWDFFFFKFLKQK